MTDLHTELEDWLTTGASSDPSREMAVHASVCDDCLARLGALDALDRLVIDGSGAPPARVPPGRGRFVLAWIRRGTAVTGAVVAGAIVVVVALNVTQFLGLRDSGAPLSPGEGVVLGGLSSETGAPSPQDSGGGTPETDPAAAPPPSVQEGESAASTPALVASLPPQATPKPSTAPTAGPPATPAPTAPSPPMSLIAVPSSGSVELSWLPPANDGGSPVTEYIVRWSPNGNSWSILATVAGTTYSDGRVGTGTYYYYVTALNVFGESAASNSASAPAPAPVPTPVPTPVPSASP